MSGIPTAWQDDGKHLKPQGCTFDIVLGFRDYILQHDWNPENWPLEDEQHLPQLELSNPALGAGSRQRFRLSTLEWTSARGTFEGWPGQELQALDSLALQRLNEITTLKQQIQQLQQGHLPAAQLSPSTRQMLSELAKALGLS